MTFELELSEHSKTHFIVHTALLKSASDKAKLTKIMNVKKYKNQNYIVKKILEKNQIDEINYYFVKWKNYNNSKNIWKFIKHFEKSTEFHHFLNNNFSDLLVSEINADTIFSVLSDDFWANLDVEENFSMSAESSQNVQ